MKVLIVSNMFPDEKHPSYGIFVKRFCSQVKMIGIDYDEAFMYKKDNAFLKLFGYIEFYLITLFKLLTRNYDIIYVHYPSYSALPVIIASYFKKFKIYTNVHGSDIIPENNIQHLMNTFTRKILRLSLKIIVPSEYFKNIVKKQYVLKDKVRFFINYSCGVDNKVFFRKNNKKIFENENLRVGFVGRISKGKGWDIFLKSVKLLGKEKYKFIVVGSGSEDKDFSIMVRELNVQNFFERYDLLSEEKLNDIYNELDLLIFPTKRRGESLGLVALEAMSIGVPVIASNYAAPKYYIKNYVNGFKFEKENYRELANRIKQVYNLTKDEKLLLSLSTQKEAKKFSSKQSKKILKKVFEDF